MQPPTARLEADNMNKNVLGSQQKPQVHRLTAINSKANMGSKAKVVEYWQCFSASVVPEGV
jgi:hypothetical protein